MLAISSRSPPRSLSEVLEHLDLPAARLGEARVHAEQIGGEQRRLLAAGAGADLEDGVLVVARVPGHEQPPDLAVLRRVLLLEARHLAAGELRELGVALGEHLARARQLLADALEARARREDRAQRGELPRHAGVLPRRLLEARVGEPLLQVGGSRADVADAVDQLGHGAQPPRGPRGRPGRDIENRSVFGGLKMVRAGVRVRRQAQRGALGAARTLRTHAPTVAHHARPRNPL